MKRHILVAVAAAGLAVGMFGVRSFVTPQHTTYGHADLLVSDSIESMASKADIVVRGTLGAQVGAWNLLRQPDDLGKEAEEVRPGTDFEFNQVEYIRGEGPKKLVVTLTGGTYRGVTEPFLEELKVGTEYVLFLSQAEVGGTIKYILASAPGHLEVRGNSAIPGSVRGATHQVKPLGVEELVQRVKATPRARSVEMPSTQGNSLPPGQKELTTPNTNR